MKQSLGFTLIEVLVVISILAIVGGVFTMSIVSFTTSKNKSSSLSEVKQNGDYALSLMEQNIRNSAPPVSCNSPINDQVTIRSENGSSQVIACVETGLANSRITIGPATSIATNPTLVSRSIRVTSCSFTCQTGTSFSSDGVAIAFSLSLNSASTQVSERSQETFSTTVFLRNRK